MNLYIYVFDLSLKKGVFRTRFQSQNYWNSEIYDSEFIDVF